MRENKTHIKSFQALSMVWRNEQVATLQEQLVSADMSLIDRVRRFRTMMMSRSSSGLDRELGETMLHLSAMEVLQMPLISENGISREEETGIHIAARLPENYDMSLDDFPFHQSNYWFVMSFANIHGDVVSFSPTRYQIAISLFDMKHFSSDAKAREWIHSLLSNVDSTKLMSLNGVDYYNCKLSELRDISHGPCGIASVKGGGRTSQYMLPGNFQIGLQALYKASNERLYELVRIAGSHVLFRVRRDSPRAGSPSEYFKVMFWEAAGVFNRRGKSFEVTARADSIKTDYPDLFDILNTMCED